MKIIFFGSSDFSMYALKACQTPPFEVAMIITTPPQKKGRGLIESPTPTQLYAERHNIPFIAAPNLKSSELLEQVKTIKPDLFVVLSYGKIIPSSWLKVPARYSLNVHPSLLPKYRGAAPIQWPIILGDTETGVSIAEVTPELDAGDIFYQARIPIPEEADSRFMTEILGEASTQALSQVLHNVLKGDLIRTPQNHAVYNYARKFKKDDGRLDWTRSATQLSNQIRGLNPWPMATLSFGEEFIQILKAAPRQYSESRHSPGQVISIQGSGLLVQTGEGALELIKVRPAGKNEMSAGDYARGRHLKPGDRFPMEPNPPVLVLSQSTH